MERRVPRTSPKGASPTMFGIYVFVVLVAVGLLFAKLRGRGNDRPSVTRVVPPKSR